MLRHMRHRCSYDLWWAAQPLHAHRAASFLEIVRTVFLVFSHDYAFLRSAILVLVSSHKFKWPIEIHLVGLIESVTIAVADWVADGMVSRYRLSVLRPAFGMCLVAFLVLDLLFPGGSATVFLSCFGKLPRSRGKSSSILVAIGIFLWDSHHWQLIPQIGGIVYVLSWQTTSRSHRNPNLAFLKCSTWNCWLYQIFCMKWQVYPWAALINLGMR